LLAPAKINLDLLITGRRGDGYHLLDSVVVFTELGDEITVEKSDKLSLNISGPFADNLIVSDDNLILKAAEIVCKEYGVKPNLKFHLVKNLPVSSGIGGGSADASAALKLSTDMLNLKVSQKRLGEIALSLGADVPVCLRSTTTLMQGVGEILTPLTLSESLNMLLVNPSVSVSTTKIFQNYKLTMNGFDQLRKYNIDHIHDRLIVETLVNSRNALEVVACSIEPEILNALETLKIQQGVLLSRMSGSGATCFGIFDTRENCLKAQKAIKTDNSNWWVEATRII
jgi:4-diphosphocytidyl-2-C-methyl-D-erythritol kinase